MSSVTTGVAVQHLQASIRALAVFLGNIKQRRADLSNNVWGTTLHTHVQTLHQESAVMDEEVTKTQTGKTQFHNLRRFETGDSW